MTKGVTLIELLLVITLIAILSVMGTIFYGRFLAANQVDNATDTIVQQLRKAQLYAMQSRKNGSSGWGVMYAGGQIVLYQGNTYAARNPTWDEQLLVTGNISISAFEVNFARGNGVPDGAETINITGVNDSETVSVNSQGGVTR